MTALTASLDSDNDDDLIPETRATLLHLSAALIAHLSQQQSASHEKEVLHGLVKESVEMFATQRQSFQKVNTI